MESEKNLEIDKSLASIPLIHCNSVGGALARNLGFSENFGSEMATSRMQSDTNRTFLKTYKKDFLPFLNERDGMNRLLSNQSRFRPTGPIEDSLNPTFYYKSSRFNKFKLILGQAERTKNSLGKLLSFQNGNEQGPNFLEADKIKRTNKLEVLDKNTSAKLDSWLQSERNPPLTEQSEDDIEEKNIFQPSHLVVDVPILHSSNKNQSLACSLSKYVSDMNAKKDQTFVIGDTITTPKTGSHPSKKQTKSLSGISKNIFAPKNDFCNYYQKLDQDIRNINTSSFDLRRKAHSSVSNLNAIIKKFEEDKDALLLEDLYILSTPPKLSQRTPRMEWFTSVGSPREEFVKNKTRLLGVESQPLSLSVQTPEKKTPQKKKSSSKALS